MGEWYKGSYRVIADVDSLSRMPHIAQGDIIGHASGAVVLRCPACNAIQFGRAAILNSPDTPTLDRPLQCGSGHCKACAVWFQIRNGRAEKAEAPPVPKTKLPEKLVRAGVRPAPKLKIGE